MSSIGDLRQQVEAEPDSPELRWRLAKKLYAGSEYREALTHLRVLKKEWEPRLNVLRYLGAAYFRLGRYDEAVRELLECLDTWPEEVAIREQLAKVYEAAGRDTDALRAWEAILELDPKHRLARKSITRISQPAAPTPRPLTIGSSSDDGIDLRPIIVCHECGAQNSAEFDRCWQCGADLVVDAAPAERYSVATPIRPHGLWAPGESRLLARSAKLAFAGALLAAVITSVLFLPQALADPERTDPARTVSEVFLRDLAVIRIVLWLACGISASIAMGVIRRAFDIDRDGTWMAVGVGGGLATALYAASWLPVNAVPIVAGGVTVAAWPLVVGAVGLGWARGTAAWGAVVVAVGVTGAGVLMATTGPAPITEAGAISAFSARQEAMPEPGVFPAMARPVPGRFGIIWGPTGSEWLDSIANDVRITVVSEPLDPPVRFELYDTPAHGELIDFVELTESSKSIRLRVTPGNEYSAVLRSRHEPSEASLTFEGVLAPQLTETEGSAL